jgi:hypothetical protein
MTFSRIGVEAFLRVLVGLVVVLLATEAAIVALAGRSVATP